MIKRFFYPIASIISFILICHVALAATSFYEGKNMRIVVGASPGGGYDAYARLVARHMGKYIPGHPVIVVENMSGAGSLIAANHIYNVAKPDGLSIGSFSTQVLNQVLGRPGIVFDSLKFEYIGAPAQDNIICMLSKLSAVTGLDQWLATKRQVKMGGLAPGTHSMDNAARVMKTVLGFPIHLISGYKGTADIRLAVEGGELDGLCIGWESAKTTWRKAIDAGDVSILMQLTPKPLRGLPNVPLAISFAKTDEARKLIQAGIHDNALIARPYALPPGTPNDRVQILRKAFEETFKDKEFLEEAGKAKLDLGLVTGEELEKVISGLFKLEPNLLNKLRDILFK